MALPQEPSLANDLQDSVSGVRLPDLETSMNCAIRAQQGDSDALNQLLARYNERLLRIVRVRLSAALKKLVEPEDIVQETLLVAARKIDQLELHSHASILNWLARIAERQILDERRYHFAQRRDRRRELAMGDRKADDSSAGEAQLAASQTSPDLRAWKGELRTIMDEALATLPEDDREVILLRDYSGAEWSEIHQRLGRESLHACQELHRRAWIRLVRGVAAKLSGDAPS